MMTPQEMINLPGYGSARPHLVKQKQWDEYAGLPYRKFSVEMRAEIVIEDTIHVRARHKDEADDMAVKKFASDHDCDESEVETVDIMDSMEGYQ